MDGARLKRVVLIGDHNQLPPIIQNMALQKFSHLDQSLFARFVRLGVQAVQLDKQVTESTPGVDPAEYSGISRNIPGQGHKGYKALEEHLDQSLFARFVRLGVQAVQLDKQVTESTPGVDPAEYSGISRNILGQGHKGYKALEEHLDQSLFARFVRLGVQAVQLDKQVTESTQGVDPCRNFENIPHYFW
jgi:hypothetical protein